MHVHLSAVAPGSADVPRFVDDFYTGSCAALAGGVTTFGQMSFPDTDDQCVPEAIARDLAATAQQAVADYVLHAGVFTASDETLAAIPALAGDGHYSLKIIMLAFDHGPRNLVAAIRAAGQAGMLTLVHCEDEALIQFTTDDLVKAGHGGLQHYPASRPDYTESVAVERAIAISEATGSPICIVHLSSRAALEAVRRARARGVRVYVETRPIYLHLTQEVHHRDEPGRYVGMPPVRTSHDADALWSGLADGSIDTLGSDHAPWFLRDKIDPALNVSTSRKGVAELETMLPMLYSAGVATGRLSLERFVAVTSTNPAKLNGIYPRKGTIAVGSDADLVVLDPQLARTVDGAAMYSRAGYSVYDGQVVTGWPRFTLSRGDVVLADGVVAGEQGRGQLVPRQPTAPL
jgi:dihydropyrimidinase